MPGAAARRIGGRGLTLAAVIALAACASSPETPASAVPSAAPQAAPAPGSAPAAPPAGESPAAAESASDASAALERRLALRELQIWERDAAIDDLRTRLDDALQEVVRAMAKLQSLATRAEAASAMAEADVALGSIRDISRDTTAARQAARFMQLSSGEFRRQNYGGALYLANQAKIAAARVPRTAIGERGQLRQGEVPFTLPIKLRATGGRTNIRSGPGTGFAVVTVVNSGAALSGLSHLRDWVRVQDEAGHQGWIARSRVERPVAIED